MTATMSDGVVHPYATGSADNVNGPTPVALSKPEAQRVSVIVPTYNEHSNVEPLVAALGEVLSLQSNLDWEVIFVDDDSPDGTADAVRALARSEPRVRCLRRIGRRGLSSAVIEGVLAANGDAVVVMDADFQHDHTIIPKMLERLIDEKADIVVASRYTEGGGIGDWNARRAAMSGFATRTARMLVGEQTSDPMSGFFAIRRAVFLGAVYDLSQQGYKILLDLISSSPRPLRILEVPYAFGSRAEGESKLSPMVLAEFGFLVIEKLSRGLIPPRFVLFSLVGGSGLLVHLAVLQLAGGIGEGFLKAQVAATLIAILYNFVVNNEFTYRDRRLRGTRWAIGLVLFALVCSIGAIANIGVANLAIERINNWPLAGIAGALIGAVFNFGAASSLVWKRRRQQVVFEEAAAV